MTRWVLLFLTVILGGCWPEDPTAAETEEKHYQRGQRLLKEGRDPEALEAFLVVIDKRPADAAESQLEAGRLYLKAGNDPVAAIYHLRRYLALRPKSEQAPMVRQMIETAKKQFAQSLPGKPFGEEDHLDLLELLELERLKNQQLSAALEALRSGNRKAQASQPSELPGAYTPRPVAVTQAVAVRTYTVQPSDTLSKISTAVYGNPNKWQILLSANSDILRSPKDLRPGQVLKIPPLTP